MFLPSSVRIAIYISLCSFPISDGRQRKKPLHPPKTHSFRKNSFISLRRLFSFSNALIRFLSCWFSSAIFRDSSGLRSPQPISRLPIFTFLIQPYSIFRVSEVHSLLLPHLSFLQALLPALCTHFHIVYSLTFLFPPFFFFIPLRLGCQVLLYYIILFIAKK